MKLYIKNIFNILNFLNIIVRVIILYAAVMGL